MSRFELYFRGGPEGLVGGFQVRLQEGEATKMMA